MEKQLLHVEGMSCSHCEKAVVNALSDIGVESVKVDLEAKTVEVEFDKSKLSIESIRNEIVETGYEVV